MPIKFRGSSWYYKLIPRHVRKWVIKWPLKLLDICESPSGYPPPDFPKPFGDIQLTEIWHVEISSKSSAKHSQSTPNTIISDPLPAPNAIREVLRGSKIFFLSKKGPHALCYLTEIWHVEISSKLSAELSKSTPNTIISDPLPVPNTIGDWWKRFEDIQSLISLMSWHYI